MSVEEEVAQLREENQALREALEQARDQLSQTQEIVHNELLIDIEAKMWPRCHYQKRIGLAVSA